MKKILLLISIIVFLTIHAFSQSKKVDNFIFGNDSVVVYFFDPLLSLNNIDKDFQSKSDNEKSNSLDKYLHENPLYLFRLTNTSTKSIRYLCIRGNPEKVNTKMFYKVELIKNVQPDFMPADNNYSDKIIQVFDQVNCGGTLFESMTLFDTEKNKNAVGNGIQFFGKYRRVQPYSEIKTSVTNIIAGFPADK